jgi:hypothetical protein
MLTLCTVISTLRFEPGTSYVRGTVVLTCPGTVFRSCPQHDGHYYYYYYYYYYCLGWGEIESLGAVALYSHIVPAQDDKGDTEGHGAVVK